MGTVMTIEEIEREFASEWVLLEDPETTPLQQVIAGRVLWHSKELAELEHKAAELRARHSAIIYTGRVAADMVFAL